MTFGEHFAAMHHDGERPSFTGITGPKLTFPEDKPEDFVFASEV